MVGRHQWLSDFSLLPAWPAFDDMLVDILSPIVYYLAANKIASISIRRITFSNVSVIKIFQEVYFWLKEL